MVFLKEEYIFTFPVPMKYMNIGKQMIKGVPSNLPESTRVVHYISVSIDFKGLFV